MMSGEESAAELGFGARRPHYNNSGADDDFLSGNEAGAYHHRGTQRRVRSRTGGPAFGVSDDTDAPLFGTQSSPLPPPIPRPTYGRPLQPILHRPATLRRRSSPAVPPPPSPPAAWTTRTVWLPLADRDPAILVVRTASSLLRHCRRLFHNTTPRRRRHTTARTSSSSFSLAGLAATPHAKLLVAGNTARLLDYLQDTARRGPSFLQDDEWFDRPLSSSSSSTHVAAQWTPGWLTLLLAGVAKMPAALAPVLAAAMDRVPDWTPPRARRFLLVLAQAYSRHPDAYDGALRHALRLQRGLAHDLLYCCGVKARTGSVLDATSLGSRRRGRREAGDTSSLGDSAATVTSLSSPPLSASPSPDSPPADTFVPIGAPPRPPGPRRVPSSPVLAPSPFSSALVQDAWMTADGFAPTLVLAMGQFLAGNPAVPALQRQKWAFIHLQCCHMARLLLRDNVVPLGGGTSEAAVRDHLAGLGLPPAVFDRCLAESSSAEAQVAVTRHDVLPLPAAAFAYLLAAVLQLPTQEGAPPPATVLPPVSFRPSRMEFGPYRDTTAAAPSPEAVRVSAPATTSPVASITVAVPVTPSPAEEA